MIIFFIIMIVLFSSIFSPRPYWGGWYGHRFHRPMYGPRFFMGRRPMHGYMRPRGVTHHGPMGFGGHRR